MKKYLRMQYICLERAKQPVITFCGHLFCWPCFYRWMRTGLNCSNIWPVCKALIDKSYPVIPLLLDTGTDNELLSKIKLHTRIQFQPHRTVNLGRNGTTTESNIRFTRTSIVVPYHYELDTLYYFLLFYLKQVSFCAFYCLVQWLLLLSTNKIYCHDKH